MPAASSSGTSTPPELVRAVRVVASGEALLGPCYHQEVARRIPAAPTAGHCGPSTTCPAHPARNRSADPGRARVSNAESDGTFPQPNHGQTHVAHIFGKLALQDRVQAVVLAYEAGRVQPGTNWSASSGQLNRLNSNKIVTLLLDEPGPPRAGLPCTGPRPGVEDELNLACGCSRHHCSGLVQLSLENPLLRRRR